MSCPHCRKSLRWKILAHSDTEGSLAFRRPTVVRCPYCDGILITNLHPKEQLLLGWCAAALIAIIVTAFFAGTAVALSVAAVSAALIALAATFIYLKYLAQWPRYRTGG
jgi:hypothetical protein